SPSLAKGTTAQLTATGVYSDSSTQDLTAQVTWTSSAMAVASVSNAAGSEGLVSGLATGAANVSAAMGSVSASVTVTVTAATLVAIQIAPPSPSLAKGTTLQLTATGIYTDASSQDLTDQVTWSSSA